MNLDHTRHQTDGICQPVIRQKGETFDLYASWNGAIHPGCSCDARHSFEILEGRSVKCFNRIVKPILHYTNASWTYLPLFPQNAERNILARSHHHAQELCEGGHQDELIGL